MEIVFTSTTALAAAIRAGDLSATEVLDAHLAQIEEHNPTLNAIVTLDAEQAQQRARAADAALARGEVWGPLHGVPFVLKDAHSTQGMRTTVGFPPFADCVPQEDGTVAARLKAAGGILMGKSNVHIMLGDPLQSINPLFGRTNNPWNSERTPGGSSGGAAAAVAAGMTPFDIGTDLAGSIRIPAHFCGIFGLKPTENRVSVTGLIPNSHNVPRSLRMMSSIGPLARTVDDLALLYQLIAGPDGRDTEVQPVPVDLMPEVALQDLRIAVAPSLAGFPVAAEVRKAVEELAAYLKPLCAVVEEATLPSLDFSQDVANAGELIGMMLGAFQPPEPSAPTTLAQYLGMLHQRDHAINAWEQFFETWDVLLSPPSMLTAFPHCEPGSPLTVDGQELTYWLGNAHCTLFNYSGNPAMTLPYKLDHAGLPIGIHLVGKRWDESRLLAIAKALTSITGEFRPPPGYEGLSVQAIRSTKEAHASSKT
jgi:amidase